MVNDSAVQIIEPLDLDHVDVLPDCRASTRRGVKFFFGVAHLPIACANCGAAGGYVPEDGVHFAFWLCTKCVEQYGVPAGAMALPDEVFWHAVHQEAIDTRGAVLADADLAKIVESDTSPLATLIKQGHV